MPQARRHHAEYVATGALPGIRPEDAGEADEAEPEETPPPAYLAGIPCPECSTLALTRRAGADRVDCGACGASLPLS